MVSHERDARLYLAHMFFGELSIITERGRLRYQALSKRPHHTPSDRQWMSLHDFNWAEPNTGEVLLRLWDTRHGLQSGEYIKIDGDTGASKGELYWCGHVTEVGGPPSVLGRNRIAALTLGESMIRRNRSPHWIVLPTTVKEDQHRK